MMLTITADRYTVRDERPNKFPNLYPTTQYEENHSMPLYRRDTL